MPVFCFDRFNLQSEVLSINFSEISGCSPECRDDMAAFKFIHNSIVINGANETAATSFIARMLHVSNKDIIALVSGVKAETQCYERVETELYSVGLSLRDIMPNRIKVMIVTKNQNFDTMCNLLSDRRM